jgi:hypothetical protein
MLLNKHFTLSRVPRKPMAVSLHRFFYGLRAVLQLFYCGMQRLKSYSSFSGLAV